MVLRIYRTTSVVLLALLALMPLLFWHDIIFATFVTTVITLILILIAFQTQRLRMLAHTLAKLDELLELLRDTRRELSPTESRQIQRELTRVRARLLRENSLRQPKP